MNHPALLYGFCRCIRGREALSVFSCGHPLDLPIGPGGDSVWSVGALYQLLRRLCQSASVEDGVAVARLIGEIDTIVSQDGRPDKAWFRLVL